MLTLHLSFQMSPIQMPKTVITHSHIQHVSVAQRYNQSYIFTKSINRDLVPRQSSTTLEPLK